MGDSALTSHTLFIDPGVKWCGVAEFINTIEDGTVLLQAWLEDTEILIHRLNTDSPPVTRVVECPRIYPSARQKGDQNDLISLALVVGRLTTGFQWKLIYPRDWKGTVNADVMTQRIIAIAKQRMDTSAVRLPRQKSLAHNVWDAVGMGYAHFNIMNQKHIFRGGRSAESN